MGVGDLPWVSGTLVWVPPRLRGCFDTTVEYNSPPMVLPAKYRRFPVLQKGQKRSVGPNPTGCTKEHARRCIKRPAATIM